MSTVRRALPLGLVVGAILVAAFLHATGGPTSKAATGPATQPFAAQDRYSTYRFFAKITVQTDLKKESSLGVLLQDSHDAILAFFAASKGKTFTEDELKSVSVPALGGGRVKLGDFSTMHVDFIERPAAAKVTRLAAPSAGVREGAKAQ